MILPPTLRKLTLLLHIVSSVGSLGAIVAFLVLAMVGLGSHDAGQAQGVYVAMDVIARFVIVPFVFGSVLTGLIQSLGTAWGLFRHYWVLVKLLLTVFTAIVLLLQLGGIAFIAKEAILRTWLGSEFLELRQSLFIHAIGGLIVLVLTTVLSVFKPRGLTRYGWRVTHERKDI